MAIPVALLLLMGLVLGRQLLQMNEDQYWSDHSEQVVGATNEALAQIVDQETAVRGFLLTGDRAFLEPYERANPIGTFERLHGLTADNAPQQQAYDEARRRYEAWAVATAAATKPHELVAQREAETLRDRKILMDQTRASLARALEREEVLRRDRVARSRSSTETTKYLFFGLLIAAAGALAFLSRRQLAAIAETFDRALVSEKEARAATEAEAWVRAGRGKLVDALQGDRPVDQLAQEGLAAIATYVAADVGAIFTSDAGAWHRRAGFGLDSREAGPATFEAGEGLVGRAAQGKEVVHLTDVPGDFLKVRSGTGETKPVAVAIVPAVVDGVVNAVLELGFLRPIPPSTLELLGRVGESLAVAVRSSEQKQRLRDLLEEAQRQAEELQTQQEELRVTNEELEAQTSALRTARTQLENQQAELEQTNDSLLAQSKLLERRNDELADKQIELEARTREVERTSQFKSEFLSNMSHELRTPLNSSLILAKLLSENKEGNLTAEQVRFAETIYGAGNDLLTLINDILDLSKIEAGKMDVRVAPVTIERLRGTLLRTFEPVAHSKGLRLAIEVEAGAPPSLHTDGQRLEQILKNLLSNALKFTDKGEVTVAVSAAADRVVFRVRDTGIGIPPDQQSIIFEAFRQADGTTNRKYGGTGLGLSISRELAHLLGGELSVTSEAGKGSTFVLTCPITYAGPAARSTSIPAPAPARPGPLVPTMPEPGPREDEPPPLVPEGARVVLVIEDDEDFAAVLASVAQDAGFFCVTAGTAERGVRLARQLGPLGIVLDMKLPDRGGLSVLDRLKRDPVTRHIPVHVISARDETATALAMGATAYLLKPVDREQLVGALRALEARATHRVRRVLVVDDDATLRESVAKLLAREDVEITTAETAGRALELLRERTFDCVVTDLGLPDQSGYELLETMAQGEPYSVPPVIVYTGRALTIEEEQRLRKYSSSIIVKGARSPERLLDEVTLFLHQVESELPPEQRRLLERARHRDAAFENRVVLVVEDDVRNVFALTSILEPLGTKVVIARNGREGLEALEREPRVDLVLMDIMMPEMDGFEATRRIRKNPRFAKLPVLALTAKAMRDDQEKCLAAGANDYLAKPLDVEVLLSLLRVWMPQP